jgi:FG-GAP-like repeat/Salmonella virulence plasmid 65kDa B protein
VKITLLKLREVTHSEKTRSIKRQALLLLISIALVVPDHIVVAQTELTPTQLPGSRPQPTAEEGGVFSIEARTGAANYTYSLRLPPARGLAPSLALAYSSYGSVRSDVAEGWSLLLPAIRRDVKREANALDRQYTAYFGGMQELVPTPQDAIANDGIAYRPRFDQTFSRYELVGRGTDAYWVVRTTEGVTHEFRQLMPDDWRLARSFDVWGNTITYTYLPVLLSSSDPFCPGFLIPFCVQSFGEEPVDYVLSAIQYTSNPNLHNDGWARVELTYTAAPTTCIWSGQATPLELPVGSSISYITGHRRIIGVWQLDSIVAWVNDSSWRTVHRWHFTYDNNDGNGNACAGRNSVRRFLTDIVERGYTRDGAETLGSTEHFEYGHLPYATPPSPRNIGFPQSKKCNDTAMSDAGFSSLILDFDGDSVPDRITLSTPPVGNAAWQASHGDGTTFSDPIPLELPTTGASPITGQEPPGNNLSGAWGWHGPNGSKKSRLDYRWVDVDGDGLVDLVAGGSWVPGARNGPPRIRFTTNECINPTPSCVDNPTSCQRISCSQAYGGTTARVKPFFSPSPEGNQDPTDVCGNGYEWLVLHNLGGTLGPPEWWCSPVAVGSNPVPYGSNYAPASSYLFDFVDINGDGIPDVISASLTRGSFFLPTDGRVGYYCPSSAPELQTRMALNVFLGDGHGNFSTAQLWVAPNWPVNCRDSEPAWNTLLDMNGDGLPDLVHETEYISGTTPTGSPIWAQALYVAYNNGHGFEPVPIQILSDAGPLFPFRFDAPNECASVHGSFLKDVDGDGIPDLACMDQSRCANPGIAFGFGAGFHSPTILSVISWEEERSSGPLFRHDLSPESQRSTDSLSLRQEHRCQCREGQPEQTKIPVLLTNTQFGITLILMVMESQINTFKPIQEKEVMERPWSGFQQMTKHQGY